MSAYYNEHDAQTAAWLRELIKAGLIADGEVDTRSIVDVRGDDLRGFAQCHFFAGIGGWSLALRLAGWPDDSPVWTGSCPCQPFSSAGAQAGGHDSRDLWPAWFKLLRECRPAVVFGEQVESAIAHGWYDRVCDDMEREGYAVGASGLPASSVGAFHIRQRLWFVADTRHWTGAGGDAGLDCQASGGWQEDAGPTRRSGEDGEFADTDDARPQGRLSAVVPERADQCAVGPSGTSGELGYAGSARSRRDAGTVPGAQREGTTGWGIAGRIAHEPEPASNAGFWSGAEWIDCTDGKRRPVEPGTFPLAHGLPARVGRLRGYGNAIVPQVAAEFIGAYMEAI